MRMAQVRTHPVVACAADLKVDELARMMRDQHVTHDIVVEQREGKPIPLGIAPFRGMAVRVLAAASIRSHAALAIS